MLTKAEGDRLLEELRAVIDRHVESGARADRPDRAISRSGDQPRAEPSGEIAVASDRDLDGEYGNPEVKFNPRNWKGEDMRGRHYSECPAAFLEQLAHALQWKSERNAAEGKDKYAKYDRLDAARAKGWARRADAQAQSGGRRAPASTTDDFGPSPPADGSDIPF